MTDQPYDQEQDPTPTLEEPDPADTAAVVLPDGDTGDQDPAADTDDTDDDDDAG